MMDFKNAIMQRLQKLQGVPGSDSAAKPMQDPRSLVGLLSRGSNVYNATSSAAHRGGGPQFGRPSMDAVSRRLNGRPNS